MIEGLTVLMAGTAGGLEANLMFHRDLYFSAECIYSTRPDLV